MKYTKKEIVVFIGTIAALILSLYVLSNREVYDKFACKVYEDGTYSGQYEGHPVNLIWKNGKMTCEFTDMPVSDFNEDRRIIERDQLKKDKQELKERLKN